jgi:hypothetical protein
MFVQTGKAQTKARNVLLRELFLLDPVLQPALLRIRNLCLDVVEMQLCTIDLEKIYTLEEFLAAQQHHVDNVRVSESQSHVFLCAVCVCCVCVPCAVCVCVGCGAVRVSAFGGSQSPPPPPPLARSLLQH